MIISVELEFWEIVITCRDGSRWAIEHSLDRWRHQSLPCISSKTPHQWHRCVSFLICLCFRRKDLWDSDSNCQYGRLWILWAWGQWGDQEGVQGLRWRLGSPQEGRLDDATSHSKASSWIQGHGNTPVWCLDRHLSQGEFKWVGLVLFIHFFLSVERPGAKSWYGRWSMVSIWREGKKISMRDFLSSSLTHSSTLIMSFRTFSWGVR